VGVFCSKTISAKLQKTGFVIFSVLQQNLEVSSKRGDLGDRSLSYYVLICKLGKKSMIKSSLVLQKINSAFQAISYPGDLHIVYDNSGYHLECMEIREAFAGKHWSDLKLETLVYQNSALSFMTPEAFRFYLPAYLSIVINKFDKTDILPDNIVLTLTLPVQSDSLHKLNIIQQHSRNYLHGTNPISNELQEIINQILIDEMSNSNQRVHRFFERVSGFNQQQCQAIRYFLEYLSSEKQDDFIHNEPQVAIDRYWFIFPL
jgi:hypothetical protein